MHGEPWEQGGGPEGSLGFGVRFYVEQDAGTEGQTFTKSQMKKGGKRGWEEE